MLAPYEGNDSLEAPASHQADGLPSPPRVDDSLSEPFVRPLDSLLDNHSELVLADDQETVELPACPLQTLTPLLGRDTALTWVFAGVRLKGDGTFGDGRLAGEWFAEEWRAESGRQLDVVIDATWPDCKAAILKAHLKSRVVRHRPDIAFLFLDNSDADAGIEDFAQFERRLVAILSVLAEIGAQAVLVQSPLPTATAGVDHEIYFEAVAGVARERGIAHVVLPGPASAASTLRARTPDSPARAAALHLCRHAVQAMPAGRS